MLASTSGRTNVGSYASMEERSYRGYEAQSPVPSEFQGAGTSGFPSVGGFPRPQETWDLQTRGASIQEQWLEGVMAKAFHMDHDVSRGDDLEVLCFMSTAEVAMRKASGLQAPVECWGCKHVPRFYQDRFQMYRH